MYKNLLIGLLIFIGTILNAEIYVKQNIKALYKNVKLTDKQKDYILDNQDTNIDLIKKELKKEVKKLHIKNLNEKNIISFDFETNKKIKNFKFLKNSDERKIDKITKKAIKKVISKFEKPENKTPMRFIISYKIGQTQNYTTNTKTNKKNEPIFISINRGTTRFEYSPKEYVRVFETNEDGFINVEATPSMCTSMKILTDKNQRVQTGYSPWMINSTLPKGKYKLLLKIKQKCDIHLQYL